MKSECPLEGLAVEISPNEVTGVPARGRILHASADRNTVTIALDQPLVIEQNEYPWAVASPRRGGMYVTELADGKSLGCSVTWVDRDRFRENDPFNLGWWRGGAAAVADITPIRDLP